MRGPWKLLVVLAGLSLSCAGPSRDTGVSPQLLPISENPGGTLRASGGPAAVFLTRPPASDSGEISGPAPLDVEFNMCRSTDPDDDDLRFTYDFDLRGDDDSVDYFGHCRQTQTFAAGCRRVRTCVTEKRLSPERVCQDYVVCAEGAPPTGPFLTRTLGLTAIIGGGGSFTITGGGAIPLAALQSAKRIVVTSTITQNTTTTSMFIGLSTTGLPQVYEAGCPNFVGQTGTVTFELTPGQFTGAANLFTLRAVPAATVRITSTTISLYD